LRFSIINSKKKGKGGFTSQDYTDQRTHEGKGAKPK